MNIDGTKYLSKGSWKDSDDLWLAFPDYPSSDYTSPVGLVKTLAEAKWIRVFASKHNVEEDLAILRIYVLPDDVGRRYVERNVPFLRKLLARLIDDLDTSCNLWNGSGPVRNFDSGIERNGEDSLFYIFNTLPSPPSAPPSVSCPISNDAIQSVFSNNGISGLRTTLYPYQVRTIATMIRREVEPAKALDPRFEHFQGPLGNPYYYDKETGILLRDAIVYDEARGGLLGESMGLGKTLICLATVLATKGHWPDIPPEHSTAIRPVKSTVGSLAQMAAATLGRSKIPWRAIFQERARAGEDHKTCRAMMELNVGSYVIPAPIRRQNRRLSTIAPGKTLFLSTATLIVVPQNLLSQWKNEISLHIEDDALEVLYIYTDDKTALPSAANLLQYDVILMSKQTFEHEMVPSETAKARSRARKVDHGGCSCSLDDNCHCSTSGDYHSPFKDLHFLRLIMDEGHEFSSSGRKSNVYWALQLLHVERKWIVSGTPANGLLGVEVGTTLHETHDSDDHSQMINNMNLEVRRMESALIQERRDLEKLGSIVAGFLQVKPWANSAGDDPASWQKYIVPHEDGRRKARSLRSLLQSLVVRHRIEDIYADIRLPPLHNRVIYLQPSFLDKISINLFLLNLTANALTSERVDQDYMFHPRNRRQLHILIQNLRQSGFYWTGISPESVAKTLEVSKTYYEEHGCLNAEEHKEDWLLMQNALAIGNIAMKSASWKAISEFHEMGIFVEEFPEDAKESWSLIKVNESGPVLLGATQLLKAQNWIDTHLYASEPSHGLSDVGSSTMQKARQDAQRRANDILSRVSQSGEVQDAFSRRTMAASRGTRRLTEKLTVSRGKAGSSSQIAQGDHGPDKFRSPIAAAQPSPHKSALKSALKQVRRDESLNAIPAGSSLRKTRISGTASAKLSYLLDRVAILHQDEKILIFYEGDSVAWYIAQALDLLSIRYLIYTKSLSLARQNAYITTFNNTETFRVLIMNVYQAAHGLHIASASRVFFVNPVWQPNVEAQAIKRAHRIGQTRPVYVETLVLKDTLEDQMLQRRKGMTAQEHQKAEKSLLDDDTMSTLIKNAKFLPFEEDEVNDISKQVAKLSMPQTLFGRVGKGNGNVDDPDADLIFPKGSPSSKKKSRIRKTVDSESYDEAPPLEHGVGNNDDFNPRIGEMHESPSSGSKHSDLSSSDARTGRNDNVGDISENEASSSEAGRRIRFIVEEEPRSLFGG